MWKCSPYWTKVVSKGIQCHHMCLSPQKTVRERGWKLRQRFASFTIYYLL